VSAPRVIYLDRLSPLRRLVLLTLQALSPQGRIPPRPSRWLMNHWGEDEDPLWPNTPPTRRPGGRNPTGESHVSRPHLRDAPPPRQHDGAVFSSWGT
jgi:hypothetical protein